LAAASRTQTIQDSVFAVEQILMIQIMLEVAVLKIQTAQELAVCLHNVLTPFEIGLEIKKMF
jgi:hypothetical protein